MSRSPIVRRIRKHRLFEGEKRVSHKEAIRRINGIRRKKIGRSNNLSLASWMNELGFRKEWVGGKAHCTNSRLWWVRE